VRISLADILQDGPFSAFAGVQRWFAVVQGEGVQLQLGQQHHRLTPASAPLNFDGAAAPGCQLLGGPTRDLNLMLQGCTGGMLAAQPGVAWQAPLPAVPQPQAALPRLLRAVFCADAAQLHIGDRPAMDLPAMSLGWWLQDGDADDAQGTDTASWRLEPMDTSAARAWWLWAWCHGLTTPPDTPAGARA
jgi:environmental stress-induced protein Ves